MYVVPHFGLDIHLSVLAIRIAFKNAKNHISVY